MKKKVLIIFGLVLIISIAAQFLLLDGFELSDWKSLNINIMVSILSTLATVFIIDNLVKKHESQKKMNDYLSNLELSHKRFVHKIKSKYIQIITKEPKDTDLEELVGNLNSYIDKSFVRKKIKILVINNSSIFENSEQETDYFTFCTDFKKSIEQEITLYLNRYASVIPPEIMNHILIIDNLLKSNMLVSPMDFGIHDHRIDINTVDFDPADYIDVFTSIGIEIIALQKVIR